MTRKPEMASTAGNDNLVVVTGASGFIATHIVKQLQEQGYRVRGTVRSLKNEDSISHFKDLCPDAQHKIELFEADLLNAESWESAIQDATYVIHVASPVPNAHPKHEDDVIKPAVEGTLHVLKACVNAKTVKRVVLTSSVSAIAPSKTAGKLHNEEDWNDPGCAGTYEKSKILAEKAAWKFIKELPDETKLELAVINPSYVVGPVLQNTFRAGMELPKRFLERLMPLVPKIGFGVVDVRDVAAAHIKALFIPDAAGHRHIVSSKRMWLSEMGKLFDNEFRDQGYNVPTRNCPSFLIWISSFFDKDVSMILPFLDREFHLDNGRMREVLGITPRDEQAALLDMAYSMIERGFIKKTPKYRGQPKSSKIDDAEIKKEIG